MKNKFNKAAGILNVLIAFTFLVGCGSTNGKSMQETNGTNTKHCNQEKHKQATCPSCAGSYRYFYTFSDKTIVLICEECNCIWENPSKLELSDASGVKKFGKLFEDESSKWSSAEEVKKSQWAEIAQKNDLLIMPTS